MRTRQVCKPIFSIEKKVDVQPKIQKTNEQAVDIVVIDDKAEDPVVDIELNFAGNKDQFKTPEKFWKFIDELDWKDRSTDDMKHKRDICDLFDELNMASQKSFKDYFWKYFNELMEVFEDRGIFDSLERELEHDERKELISHIVAKGQVYYATIMKEPYFCGALVGKHSRDDDFVDFTCFLK